MASASNPPIDPKKRLCARTTCGNHRASHYRLPDGTWGKCLVNGCECPGYLETAEDTPTLPPPKH